MVLFMRVNLRMICFGVKVLCRCCWVKFIRVNFVMVYFKVKVLKNGWVEIDMKVSLIGG